MVRKTTKIGLVIAVVLAIVGVAIVLSWVFLVQRQPPQSLTAEAGRWADNYGSGVGYEIFSWTDNEATASIYLEAENGRIPFENIHFCKTGNKWWINHTRHWPILSPSRELAIVNYEVRTSTVESSFFEGEHECLIYLIPVVKNSSRWPAFVASVKLKLENSTNRYEKSYSTMGRSIEGIVGPWETTAIWYGGGAAAAHLYWYEDENLPPPTKLLRMDHLEGKTFEITITLKDGAETVLAENTFTHTF